MPNIITYNLVLHVWATSGANNVGERAEAILNYLTGHNPTHLSTSGVGFHRILQDEPLRSSAGTSAVRPNTITYGLVVHAWSTCGDPRRSE